jgi:hypothetical protein
MLVLLTACAKPLVRPTPVALNCPAIDHEPCAQLQPPLDGSAQSIEETLTEWTLEYRVCQAKQQGLSKCIERHNKRTTPDNSWCRASWCKR